MTAFHRAPERTFDYHVLLWLTRGHVPTANSSGVTVVNVAPAGELSAVARAVAVRPTYVVDVSDDLLHVHGSLNLALHPVRLHPPRCAVDDRYDNSE